MAPRKASQIDHSRGPVQHTWPVARNVELNQAMVAHVANGRRLVGHLLGIPGSCDVARWPARQNKLSSLAALLNTGGARRWSKQKRIVEFN
jgi:hypothetical protein